MGKKFDASTDRLRYTGSVGSGAFTACYWYRHDATRSSWSHVSLAFHNGSGDEDDYMYIEQGGLTGNEAQAYLWIQYSGASQGSAVGPTLSVGSWYWFCMHRTSGDVETFYWSVSPYTTISSATVSPGGSPVSYTYTDINDNPWTEWGYFTVAGLKIWDGASLSTTELYREMWSLQPQRTANLWMWHPFEDDSESTFNDYSGNARNFTESGTVTIGESPPVPWRTRRKSKVSTSTFDKKHDRIYISGAESGGIEAGWSGGTISVDSTTKRTGGYSYKVNPTTSATGYLYHGMWSPQAAALGAIDEVYARMYLYIVTAPSANWEYIAESRTSSALKLGIRLRSDRKLETYTFGAQTTTGTTVLDTSTWYRIEWYCGTGTSAPYELLIDGSSEIDTTGNVNSTGHAYVVYGKRINSNSESIEIYLDDLAYDRQRWCGAGSILKMDPDGNSTTHTDFTANTGTKWEAVDDIPHDTDTTYIYASTAGHIYTATLESASSAGIDTEDINAVMSLMQARREALVNSGVVLRSGSNTKYIDDNGLGDSYAYRGFVRSLDTNGLPWTTSTLDGTEVGCRQALFANTMRVTQSLAHVEYIPSEAPPEGQPTWKRGILVPGMKYIQPGIGMVSG